MPAAYQLWVRTTPPISPLPAPPRPAAKTAYLLGTFSSLPHTTAGGCQCLGSWHYEGSEQVYAGCANPDGDPLGPWCPVLPGSCTQPGSAKGKAPRHRTTDEAKGRC